MRRITLFFLACLVGCSSTSSGSSGSDPNAATSGTSTTSGGDRASSGTSSGASSSAAQVTPPPPPPPPPPPRPSGPPAPRFTEMQAYLRSEPRGMRCFQHNVITADLSEAFIDIDLDGDGRDERVFQFPDCLAVSAQRTDRWELIGLSPREVQRDVEVVTLRAATRNGQRVVEITDLRGTNREVTRYRWNGNDLTQVP